MVKVTVSVGTVRTNLLDRIPVAVRQVEQAVIQSCEPFVPYDTGELCRSATSAGEGTNGLVIYTAPHAAECYYADRPFGKRHHPKACARWFEAAKAVDITKWMTTAADALTGKNSLDGRRKGRSR